jgi:hypothetical protein
MEQSEEDKQIEQLVQNTDVIDENTNPGSNTNPLDLENWPG